MEVPTSVNGRRNISDFLRQWSCRQHPCVWPSASQQESSYWPLSSIDTESHVGDDELTALLPPLTRQGNLERHCLLAQAIRLVWCHNPIAEAEAFSNNLALLIHCLKSVWQWKRGKNTVKWQQVIKCTAKWVDEDAPRKQTCRNPGK